MARAQPPWSPAGLLLLVLGIYVLERNAYTRAKGAPEPMQLV